MRDKVFGWPGKSRRALPSSRLPHARRAGGGRGAAGAHHSPAPQRALFTLPIVLHDLGKIGARFRGIIELGALRPLVGAIVGHHGPPTAGPDDWDRMTAVRFHAPPSLTVAQGRVVLSAEFRDVRAQGTASDDAICGGWIGGNRRRALLADAASASSIGPCWQCCRPSSLPCAVGPVVQAADRG